MSWLRHPEPSFQLLAHSQERNVLWGIWLMSFTCLYLPIYLDGKMRGMTPSFVMCVFYIFSFDFSYFQSESQPFPFQYFSTQQDIDCSTTRNLCMGSYIPSQEYAHGLALEAYLEYSDVSSWHWTGPCVLAEWASVTHLRWAKTAGRRYRFSLYSGINCYIVASALSKGDQDREILDALKCHRHESSLLYVLRHQLTLSLKHILNSQRLWPRFVLCCIHVYDIPTRKNFDGRKRLSTKAKSNKGKQHSFDSVLTNIGQPMKLMKILLFLPCFTLQGAPGQILSWLTCLALTLSINNYKNSLRTTNLCRPRL